MDLETRWQDLLFGVRRSVRYHNRRAGFFDRCNKVTSAMGVIFGSATIGAMLTSLGTGWAIGAASVVTVASAFDLVVGTSNMARQHGDLARRFIALESDMVAEPSEELYRQTVQRRLAIEADEPPILRVLDMLCHNELVRATGGEASQMVPVGSVQRMLAHLVDVGTDRLHTK